MVIETGLVEKLFNVGKDRFGRVQSIFSPRNQAVRQPLDHSRQISDSLDAVGLDEEAIHTSTRVNGVYAIAGDYTPKL